MRGDELDERMDAALRSYAEPEEVPQARVAAARVLEHARALQSKRRRLWLLGWVGAVVCLLVAWVIGAEWISRPRLPQIVSLPNAPGVAAHANASAEAHARISPARATAKLKSCSDTKACSGSIRTRGVELAGSSAPEPLPKLDVFPTPHPLGTEEQSLMVFGKEAPLAVRKAVIEDQQHWDDPIIVAEIDQPLESGNHQNP